MTFTSNTIENNFDYLAKELKRARQGYKLSLEKAATRLNIGINYLRAMENGDFEKLPTGVYSRNYLKEYAYFLGLNQDNLLEIFDKEMSRRAGEKKDLFSKQVVKQRYFFTIPRLIKNLAIFASVIICFVYLGFSLNKIGQPAKIQIFFPPDNLTTNDSKVNVTGATEPGTKIDINGNPVLTDSKGTFTADIDLKKGFNTIMISAEKSHGGKNVVTKQILVKG